MKVGLYTSARPITLAGLTPEKKPKKTTSLWRLIPPGPGCATTNGQMCYVEIVIPEPGEVTASTPPGAGKVRLQLRLNRAAKKVVKQKGKVAVRVRITFKPKGGKATGKTRTFTFKKKASKKPRGR